jgi:hypothetical protein
MLLKIFQITQEQNAYSSCVSEILLEASKIVKDLFQIELSTSKGLFCLITSVEVKKSGDIFFQAVILTFLFHKMSKEDRNI